MNGTKNEKEELNYENCTKQAEKIEYALVY